jgi:hypothetical protein
MKKILFLCFLSAAVLFAQPANSQEVYTMSSLESLFQWADVPNSPQSGYNSINPRLRYTIVFNYGQYWHIDFTNAIGLYSGVAIRNVGFIYDTDIATKTIRRSYNLSVPLSLKLGAFDKHFYLFGGGEYELLFHYKGKRWNSNDRSGTKIKDSEWFSSKTKRFVPAVFGGIQFPRGFNIKYKFYLQHFMNEDYVGNDLGETGIRYADYNSLQMHYISLCWQFRSDVWNTKSFSDMTAYK